MTHFFPSGITEGLPGHTWGSGEPAEELPMKRDVTARQSLRTSQGGLLIAWDTWVYLNPQGPGQDKEQGKSSMPQKRLN